MHQPSERLRRRSRRNGTCARVLGVAGEAARRYGRVVALLDGVAVAVLGVALEEDLLAAVLHCDGDPVLPPSVGRGRGLPVERRLDGELRPVAKVWLLVQLVCSAVRALRRFSWVERALAVLRAPRKVGMAMANRMAMIKRTTISSMRVKPSSSRSKRCLTALSILMCLSVFGGYGCELAFEPFTPAGKPDRVPQECCSQLRSSAVR